MPWRQSPSEHFAPPPLFGIQSSSNNPPGLRSSKEFAIDRPFARGLRLSRRPAAAVGAPAAGRNTYVHGPFQPLCLALRTSLVSPERGFQPASSWGSQALAIPTAADPPDVEVVPRRAGPRSLVR